VIVIVAPVERGKSLRRFDPSRNRERPAADNRVGEIALNCVLDLPEGRIP
jgi:hypothetical protein